MSLEIGYETWNAKASGRDDRAATAGAQWRKMRAGIERAVSHLSTRGFTLSIGEWQPDVSAVGVPIVPADRSGPFAFNCGAPALQITRERLENDVGPRLVNTALNVEAALNGA